MVGVPLTMHPESERPAGSVPAVITQEYGDVPPATPMVAVKGIPTVALGSEESVSVTAAGDTVRLTGPVIVETGLLESITLTTRFDVPGVVGMPLTMQPLITSPAGSVPEMIVQL
jgi:hypothetical protein